MANEFVSIIIPTFNRGYCIESTLRSVLSQTHRNWEAIVVDDGSTDDTRVVLERLQAADPRINYHYKKNGGVSGARNFGLSLAKGTHIAFLDSDDLWKPWKLAAQLACLRAMPDAGMVWTDMEAIDAGGRRTAARYLRTMYGAYKQASVDDIFPSGRELNSIAGLPAEVLEYAADGKAWHGDIYASMFLGNLVHTSTVLLTRERLEKVGGFDEALKISGEDYDFHLRTCRHGPVALLDAPSISYRVGAFDQLTHASHHLQMARNFLTTILAAFAHDGSDGPVGRRQRDLILAGAHAWIGEELFHAGRYVEARKSLGTSISYHLWQKRTVKLWAASWLPGTLLKQVLVIFRKLHHT